ncbi:E3 SUMO-protein ligase ZNF451 isoform X1 [Oryzias melastigma]|uniref:E3 SUMO-protein ligase ZNF451 isoform X1 n=1 Tax=Oryzias melastigma TaxID=30732 RepID=UPI000CF7E7FD|nr:E3 SUMO-protein ligase ZNF451 isoform X1 [Oryzias melastigma]XP_024153639.1 E3 SUMO-protein ligase ZNF451 isoform X1 [Oryzias melastigma]XP_024153640.1 E3 SUMO-protein ligase ZNF451 isoform X1 [Oryzias melastigma]
MSSPNQEQEDEVEEVEFVSEGPLRPVLDCIDLLSDSDEDGCSSLPVLIEDKISQHKAHVTSTLDRLAHQVAIEKKERAKKCRAFKEKQILQKAHGQQELAVSSANSVNQDAKRCVEMWLKMPGVKPGVVSAGSGRKLPSASFPRNNFTRQTCPVINCGRVYDNASLLDGHLKRFDHSPCDPEISLRGSPSEQFACVACSQQFQAKEAWRRHLESKVSSSSSDGHSMDQIYQRIVCFACPACYLLFNLRDECLQHMSAKNHFTHSLALKESKEAAMPVPVPQHVKNRLIALCKDTAFTVRCSLCHKVLTSHQVAQAHFNVYCRQGCAVAKAEKTVVEVMKQLLVKGQCSVCSKVFFSEAEMEKHKDSAQHDVEVNQTIAKALLQYSRFHRAQQEQRRSHVAGGSSQRRAREEKDCGELSVKRQRMSQGSHSSSNRTSVTAWFCECGLQFPEEGLATKHVLAVNQIFHQCGVCGKLMGESSIASLHMSRFHGGAHLSNFLYLCRKCKVQMPRFEDILSHVSEAHSGHTYIAEQEVPDVPEAKPSTSSEAAPTSSSKVQQDTVETSSSVTRGLTWMCRMCEDIFDSEAAVHKHCTDIGSHSFQRFVCGHCPQKFFKESTVRRHCMNEHDGDIKSWYFCGLCDSMQMDTEAEFLDHYWSLHSRDYCCMDNAEVLQPAAAMNPQECPCMSSEHSKERTKEVYTRCMRELAAEGRCQYTCPPCSVSVPTYAQIKTHVHTKHSVLNLDKTFQVQCNTCHKSFMGVPSFHKHYHHCHCTLEPCRSSRRSSEAEPTHVKIIHAVEVKAHKGEIEDETLGRFLEEDQTNSEKDSTAMETSDDEMKSAQSISAEEARESAELEEALQRSLVEF